MRDAALGDVQLAHHLDSRKNGGVPFLAEGRHGVLQHSIDAVLDDHFGVPGLDVDITGSALERGENDGVNQPDDGAHAGFAGELSVEMFSSLSSSSVTTWSVKPSVA